MGPRGSANGAGPQFVEHVEATAEKLRRLDVAQMVREAPPDVPWVVEGLVVRGMLTVLNGREGEGKSLLAMALSAGVATGQGEAGMVCNEGQAVIVDAENGAYEIHRRVRTLDLPVWVEVFEADGFDLRSDLAELEAILEHFAPSLLILDSFRSLWKGDENDSGDVAGVLDPVRNLVRQYQTGAVLLHHSGKGIGAAYRGSSAIGASAELGFKLAREEGDDERERRFLECWKCRPAPEPERRWLRLSVEGGRVFVDQADPPEGEHTPAAAQPVREELRPKVLAALTSIPQARADIARAVGRKPKDRSVGRVLETLRAAGEVEKREGEPGAPSQWVRVTEGGSVAAPLTVDGQPATPSTTGSAEPQEGVAAHACASTRAATPAAKAEGWPR